MRTGAYPGPFSGHTAVRQFQQAQFWKGLYSPSFRILFSGAFTAAFCLASCLISASVKAVNMFIPINTVRVCMALQSGGKIFEDSAANGTGTRASGGCARTIDRIYTDFRCTYAGFRRTCGDHRRMCMDSRRICTGYRRMCGNHRHRSADSRRIYRGYRRTHAGPSAYICRL